MAETTDELLAHLSHRLKDMQDSIERVERGIFGDTEIGHRGLVKRVDDLDQAERGATAIHQAIEERRAAGDKRAHERIDETHKKVDVVERSVLTEVARVEKKIDRLLWAFVGAGVVSGGSVAAIARIAGI
jgi:hypothetical protein